MNNKNVTQIIKSQMDLTSKMFSVMGIKANIQVYFLTEHEGKNALTKNPLFRSQGDESLLSSAKKYDYLDAESPAQIILAVNERQTKYLSLEDNDRNPKQKFVVVSPIISDERGLIGSLCFAGSTDPILDAKISFENFRVISEALAKSLAASFELFSEEELMEVGR